MHVFPVFPLRRNLFFSSLGISGCCGGDSPALWAGHQHHHPAHTEEEEEAEVKYGAKSPFVKSENHLPKVEI